MSDTHEKREKKRPVCPYCRAEMNVNNYRGCYEEFWYWSCKCDHIPFPPDDDWSGSHA